MPFFEYQAKNYDGVNVKGIIEAQSETAALEILAEKKMLPLAIKLNVGRVLNPGDHGSPPPNPLARRGNRRSDGFESLRSNDRGDF